MALAATARVLGRALPHPPNLTVDANNLDHCSARLTGFRTATYVLRRRSRGLRGCGDAYSCIDARLLVILIVPMLYVADPTPLTVAACLGTHLLERNVSTPTPRLVRVAGLQRGLVVAGRYPLPRHPGTNGSWSVSVA